MGRSMLLAASGKILCRRSPRVPDACVSPGPPSAPTEAPPVALRRATVPRAAALGEVEAEPRSDRRLARIRRRSVGSRWAVRPRRPPSFGSAPMQSRGPAVAELSDRSRGPARCPDSSADRRLTVLSTASRDGRVPVLLGDSAPRRPRGRTGHRRCRSPGGRPAQARCAALVVASASLRRENPDRTFRGSVPERCGAFRRRSVVPCAVARDGAGKRSPHAPGCDFRRRPVRPRRGRSAQGLGPCDRGPGRRAAPTAAGGAPDRTTFGRQPVSVCASAAGQGQCRSGTAEPGRRRGEPFRAAAVRCGSPRAGERCGFDPSRAPFGAGETLPVRTMVRRSCASRFRSREGMRARPSFEVELRGGHRRGEGIERAAFVVRPRISSPAEGTEPAARPEVGSPPRRSEVPSREEPLVGPALGRRFRARFAAARRAVADARRGARERPRGSPSGRGTTGAPGLCSVFGLAAGTGGVRRAVDRSSGTTCSSPLVARPSGEGGGRIDRSQRAEHPAESWGSSGRVGPRSASTARVEPRSNARPAAVLRAPPGARERPPAPARSRPESLGPRTAAAPPASRWSAVGRARPCRDDRARGRFRR